MVNKSLKKNNLVNIRNYSKKKNLVGGDNKKDLLIGFINYNNDNDNYTKTYLDNKLKYKESNKIDSTQISLLFSTILDPSGLPNSPIFNTRNCVNNLTTAIKLVEDTMSNYLLYRENDESENEKEYFKQIFKLSAINLNNESLTNNLPENSSLAGGSKNPQPQSNTRASVSENKEQILNEHIKSTFSNPLHATKLVKFSDGNKYPLHLIIYPLPILSSTTTPVAFEVYNLDYLKNLLEDKKDDMFVVLFPSLIKNEKVNSNYSNSLKIKKFITQLEGLKYEKSSSMFDTSNEKYLKKETIVLKAREDYDYGVYTRNISQNFNLKIIPTDLEKISVNRLSLIELSSLLETNFNNVGGVYNEIPNDFRKVGGLYEEIPGNLKGILQKKLQNNLGILQNNFDISSFIENNKTKNRYSNIVPYPYDTMVTLKKKKPNDDINNSYINANYVASYNKAFFKYIATQCPTGDTLNDFWRMVFQEKSTCIIMLTDLVEGVNKTKKCDKYWPEEGEQNYADINVELVVVDITTNKEYEIRQFKVSKTNDSEILTVNHYWFKSWPDHNVPDQKGKKTVIEIITKCNELNSQTPWIVHCSAGVGRTGTFIAIDHGMSKIENYKSNDYLNDYLNDSLSVSVIDIIKFIRRYRNNLVQGYEQAKFVKETLDLFLKESQKKNNG